MMSYNNEYNNEYWSFAIMGCSDAWKYYGVLHTFFKAAQNILGTVPTKIAIDECYNDLIKYVEQQQSRLAYQVLGVFLMENGAIITDDIKRLILRYSAWETEDSTTLDADSRIERQSILSDFSKKIKNYVIGIKTFVRYEKPVLPINSFWNSVSIDHRIINLNHIKRKVMQRLLTVDDFDVFEKIFIEQSRSSLLDRIIKSNCHDQIDLENELIEYFDILNGHIRHLSLEIDSRHSLMPVSISKLKKLGHLDLNIIDTKDFIIDFNTICNNIERLHLSTEGKVLIPNFFHLFPNLKELKIFSIDNESSTFHENPDSIGRLKFLNKLQIFNVLLRQIPNSLKNLKYLEVLELKNVGEILLPDFNKSFHLKKLDIS